MIQTIIKIGQKLRETGDVQYLPFIITSDRSDRKIGNKIVKTNTVIYDVDTRNDLFTIQKSNDQLLEERIKTIFIKGGNNDRFYIAGDISCKFFGKKFELIKYFQYKGINDNLDQLNPFILKFRTALLLKLPEIVEVLKMDTNIHFRFINNNAISYWEDKKSDLEEIGEFIIKNYYIDFNKKINKYVISRLPISIYTGYNLNALQFLSENNIDKVFNIEGIDDENIRNIIIGANQLSNTTLRFGKVLLQILPAGSYETQSLIDFLKVKTLKRRSTDINAEGFKEKIPFGEMVLESTMEKSERIDKFDILFLKKGGQTIDVIGYISQIHKGEIHEIVAQLSEAKETTNKFLTKENLLRYYKDENLYFDIFNSLNNLLSDQTKDNKKLEKHQITVLYKIFRGQYREDRLLLKGLIQHTEYNLRNSEKNGFIYLFADYFYINQILLINEYTSMIETKSYKIGRNLGKLAKNLDIEIKSFSKQYAGNISRRVSTLDDFQKLLNFITEKLTIHNILDNSVREILKDLTSQTTDFNEQYKKDYVVTGFFSTYLLPLT